MKRIFSLLAFTLVFHIVGYTQTKLDHLDFKIDIQSLIEKSNIRAVHHLHLGHVHLDAALVENELLGADFKKKNPDILGFDLVNEQGDAFGTALISSIGTWFYYWEGGRMITVVPNMETPDPSDHYFDQEREEKEIAICNHEEVMRDAEARRIDVSKITSRGNQRNGDIIRTYRMKLACTGEFYQLNGGNNASVNAVIAASVMGLNAVYLRELSVNIVLEDSRLYTNPASDPFTPDGAGPDTRTTQAGSVVDMNFSPGSYDIGHALHKSVQNDGWGSGGVARLGAVCRDFEFSGSPLKAQGWSGSFNNSGFSWISLFSHEVGHMFGAEHTFNGTGSSCTDAISETNAYEIGSGNTIMSYNGICDDAQNQPSNGEADNYFHIASLLQMTEYMEAEGTCATTTASNNAIPDVSANDCGETVTIPRNTPFYLKGSGSDEDGDEIFYSWEQFDEDGAGTPTQGFIGAQAGNRTNTPLFKAIPPSPGQFERYFPDLATLAAGFNSDPFQALPLRQREINFKLIGRDFKSGGGAYGFDDLLVNVANVGPLQVVAPNGANTFTTGETTDITWNTNGAESLCSSASIKLSIDGGINYNIVIADNIDFAAGTASVVIPEFLTSTNTARIMISCEDSDCAKFFDISNSNFTINSDCEADASYICPSENILLPQGDPGLNLDLSNTIGTARSEFIEDTRNGTIMTTTVFNVGGTGCTTLTNISTSQIIISASESGTYSFSVDVGYRDGFGFVSLFDEATYNNSSPCSSFISSSGSWSGTSSSVSATGSMTASLEACKEYRLIFFNYTEPNTRISNISGPGDVVEVDALGNPNFSYGYIAVNDFNNEIEAYSDEADFSTLNGGTYNIFGVQYSSDTDLSTYVGQQYNDYFEMGDCFRSSSNSFQLTIEGSCSLEKVDVGVQGMCNPDDNTFLQELILTYTEKPAMGEIQVNGQSFPITDSPQTILYQSDSDGASETVGVLFTEEPNCEFTITFDQPENCCPFNIEFEAVTNICPGDEAMLDAGEGGENGGTYVWFDSGGAEIMDVGRILTTSTAGRYTVVVTSSTGCTKTGFTNVVIETEPVVVLPEDMTICTGDLTSLIATTNSQNLQWLKDGEVLTGQTLSVLRVDTAGVYTLIAGVGTTCSVEDEIVITSLDSPAPDLGGGRTICEGDEIVLTGEGSGDIVWFKDGAVLTGETTNELMVSESGLYRIEITSGNMCSGSSQAQITVETLPTVSAGEDKAFCSGDEVTLDGMSDTQAFIWYKDGEQVASIDLEIVVDEPGEYVLEAVTAGMCNVTDTVIVTENAVPPVDLGEDKESCIGNVEMLSGPAGNNYTYNWSTGGSMISDEQSIEVTTNGAYLLVVTDENMCTAFDEAVITFTPGPTLDIDQTMAEFCEGGEVTVTATTNATSIVWLKDGTEIPGENMNTITIDEAGSYSALVEGTSGCEVERAITVVVYENPDVDLADMLTACEGELVPLSSNVMGASYQWLDEMGQEVGTTSDIEVSEPGSYQLIVTSDNNCTGSDDISVAYTQRPQVVLDGMADVCEGDQINLQAQVTAQSFQWLLDGTELVGETMDNITVSEGGTYTLIASNGSDCSDEASIDLNVQDLPMVELGADTDICPGESTDLTAGANNQDYNWSTGESTPSITVNHPDNVPTERSETYTVTVTNEFGCESTDNITITFNPNISATITGEGGICQGDSVTLVASGGQQFLWSGGPISSTMDGTVAVFPEETTTYSLVVTDILCSGNTAEATFEVEVFPPATVSAGEDKSVILGRTVSLEASGGVTYQWSADPTIVSGINSATPEVMPEVPTTYTVTGTDANGCTGTDEVFVSIIEDPISFLKQITVITPNDDGLNDELEFFGLETYPENRLVIYNRWGNVVFEKSGYQQDEILFDGTTGGDELPADTYYYVLTFDDVTIKQPLTIVRDK